MIEKNDKILLSLCIPTNGVIEWVIPVLESIYSQWNESMPVEVVVSDNGNSEDFYNKMQKYLREYENFVYHKSNAELFLNEISSYQIAKGQFIKFINHRTKLCDGALKALIDIIQDNFDEKPDMYFANGVLNKKNEVYTYFAFDEYVRDLSYWSSWSTGMGFWKEDFDKLPNDIDFNELYPHTTILFARPRKQKYIIDNRILLDEIPQGKKPKGKFDLFFASAVEYPAILGDLLRKKNISLDTFLKLKEDNLYFLAWEYYTYIIKKEYCSYDLTGYKLSLSVYYSIKEVWKKIPKIFFSEIKRKMLRRLKF